MLAVVEPRPGGDVDRGQPGPGQGVARPEDRAVEERPVLPVVGRPVEPGAAARKGLGRRHHRPAEEAHPVAQRRLGVEPGQVVEVLVARVLAPVLLERGRSAEPEGRPQARGGGKRERPDLERHRHGEAGRARHRHPDRAAIAPRGGAARHVELDPERLVAVLREVEGEGVAALADPRVDPRHQGVGPLAGAAGDRGGLLEVDVALEVDGGLPARDPLGARRGDQVGELHVDPPDRALAGAEHDLEGLELVARGRERDRWAPPASLGRGGRRIGGAHLGHRVGRPPEEVVVGTSRRRERRAEEQGREQGRSGEPAGSHE